MKLPLLTLLAVATCVPVAAQDSQLSEKLYFKFDNRFVMNEEIDIARIDSIEFQSDRMRTYRLAFEGSTQTMPKNITYRMDGEYSFSNPGCIIVKPDSYANNDYTSTNSKFCFERSRESEHFVIFWEKGLNLQANGNLTGGASSSVCNVNTLLQRAEKIWQVYVEQLGFVTPGASTTDKYKIQMYVVNQSDWRADGSGVTGKVWKPGSGSTLTQQSARTGMFHCNAWAASDEVTVAHEIGHTFQYLTAADQNGANGFNYVLGENSNGNEWWEDCANWQAHKVYPAKQFDTNWGNNQNMHHMNIIHEGARYNNCYYQDWWCQQHGLNTIARVWRESRNPEDPIQCYMRLFGLSLDAFADEQYWGYAHMASMDIERWMQYGQHLIGSEQQRLIEPSEEILSLLPAEPSGNIGNPWWVVAPDYCVQNFGYNANPLKVPAAGTEVKVQFKGMVGAPGYRQINTQYAGWRYGLVAYKEDGTRVYGEMGKTAEGEVSLVVPEGCRRLWLVVMGAPTTWWTHSWNDNDADDEQWPYAVKCFGTDPLGVSRTYGEYPADYQRRDTTVVIDCQLAASNSYTSVSVQYDMDAISQALGVSTEQMHGLLANTAPTAGKLTFAGMSPAGALSNNTTTTTSNSTVYGHWFSTSGYVCSYGGSSAIFAELTPADYKCKVGQYPDRLQRGKEYVIRQAIIYKDASNKQFKAVMEVHLHVM